MSAAPRHVLIADDQSDIGAILAKIMTRRGLIPIVVSNGTDAIAAAQSAASDLCIVILDIQMPGMSGVDAAVVIHQLVPQVPIVLMTGGIAPQTILLTTQFPIAEMLSKPLTIADVDALLDPSRVD